MTGMLFSKIGNLGKNESEISAIIESLGGTFSPEISEKSAFIFSSTLLSKKIEQARRYKIHVVDERVFESIKFNDGRVFSALRDYTISCWGVDVSITF